MLVEFFIFFSGLLHTGGSSSLSVGFFGPLAGLVPPPFVDLLLAHIEVLGVSGAKLLDALPSPHGVLPELGAKKEELTLGFAFALTVLVDFV